MNKRKYLPSLIIYTFIPLTALFILLIFFATKSESILNLLILFIFIYFVLNLVHHYLDKSLNLEIVSEYTLLAILAIAILSAIVITT